ncbi:MAG: UDP-N-acetylglucosamine pyrophosphorylase [Limnochordia bacterium]|jgi:NDP-sugar pyrophosphorylase family protein|nr:UDP-N-acetylglucosamine pyrophosphorylase [Limnochordia bacterium]
MSKNAEFFSLDGCPCPEAFAQAKYPWDVLAQIPDLICAIVQKNPGKFKQIGQGVWVGARTKVADTARFFGPAIFGDDCEIRPNAFVRGNVLAGDGVVLGNASEVKQSVLFSQVQLPHFNYAGDSILGRGAHLGAGAIISNFKSTKESVKVRVEGEVLETGLRKFGAILGDEVEVGCNAVLNPGTLVGMGSIIYPLTSVRGSIPARMICKGPGILVPYIKN